jgi:hypothetical protein
MQQRERNHQNHLNSLDETVIEASEDHAAAGNT